MAAPVFYKGIEVGAVRHNPRNDMYVIVATDGFSVIDEVDPHVYLAMPQLRMLGARNGKYWRTNPQVHGGAAQQSGHTVNWGAISIPNGPATYISVGTITVGTMCSVEYTGIRAGEVIGRRAWE